MDHAGTHHGGGVGHDADDGVIFACHLLDAGNGKACRHAAEDEAAGPLVQAELERGQQGFHHLGLDTQEDQVAPGRHLRVGGGIAAQLPGQFFGFGGRPVGQIDVLRVGGLAHRPGDGTAHVAAA